MEKQLGPWYARLYVKLRGERGVRWLRAAQEQTECVRGGKSEKGEVTAQESRESWNPKKVLAAHWGSSGELCMLLTDEPALQMYFLLGSWTMDEGITGDPFPVQPH